MNLDWTGLSPASWPITLISYHGSMTLKRKYKVTLKIRKITRTCASKLELDIIYLMPCRFSTQSNFFDPSSFQSLESSELGMSPTSRPITYVLWCGSRALKALVQNDLNLRKKIITCASKLEFDIIYLVPCRFFHPVKFLRSLKV